MAAMHLNHPPAGNALDLAARHGGEIVAKDISKSYHVDGVDSLVIHGCSLAVEKGKLTVMIGPSGCGKSTLVRLLAGFEEPTRGAILVNGKRARGPTRDCLVVFQETALFDWMTTRDNVYFGPRVRGEWAGSQQQKADELIAYVGLDKFQLKYPPQLSGGMQRRAELARAMINRPDVMILDEPFRGLDAMTKQLMQAYYAEIFEETRRTTLFITTDIDEAIFLADRILIMTNMPTRVRAAIDVPLPRPRRLGDVIESDVGNAIKMQALKILHEEAMKSFSQGSDAAADFMDAYARRSTHSHADDGGGGRMIAAKTAIGSGSTPHKFGLVENPGRGAITLEDVVKVYDADGAAVMAVDHCSLEIKAGEIFMVVGPSGCGKTTLLNAIAGFHDITSGRILLDGELLCGPGRPHADPGSDRIVVFQNGALFPWKTNLQNITFGPIMQGALTQAEAHEKALDMMADAGLAGFEHNFPGELSSGMRRRVEIVRALMNDPKVLLLDEPYRALDSLTKSVMHEALLAMYYKNKVTIFFITHDLEEAIFLGHRVAIMTTRPCRPKKIIDVDIPHPRDYGVLTSRRFRELMEETSEAVHEEALKAFSAGEKEG